MREKELMGEADMRRGLTRIAHEIIERNQGVEDLAVIGMRTRGVPLARRLAQLLESLEGQPIPVGALDVTLYRDDLNMRGVRAKLQRTDIPIDLKGKRVILVDDVLYTGRTTRAALDALIDLGRPRCVQLAVMVDRGHRELPIRPDYVVKNVPTSVQEEVQVRLQEVDGVDQVVLMGRGEDG
ncbi:MAG TPA: bifunctional pyr operon transcriptional regulator/uracil phosphoribosyltransferase PyrR [Dehalococcoidia bacterium]|nr:bifunctional pyr operon transcriptional regulator/uracil phosphoribosyltransferase PyrR [Dehalococcoidia bacterium]